MGSKHVYVNGDFNAMEEESQYYLTAISTRGSKANSECGGEFNGDLKGMKKGENQEYLPAISTRESKAVTDYRDANGDHDIYDKIHENAEIQKPTAPHIIKAVGTGSDVRVKHKLLVVICCVVVFVVGLCLGIAVSFLMPRDKGDDSQKVAQSVTSTEGGLGTSIDGLSDASTYGFPDTSTAGLPGMIISCFNFCARYFPKYFCAGHNIIM